MNRRRFLALAGIADLQRTLREYSLTGDADRIDCPTLVLAGENDHFVPVSLGHEFADEIGDNATLRVFTAEEGAAQHCQVGNRRLATNEIYDWLDDAL